MPHQPLGSSRFIPFLQTALDAARAAGALRVQLSDPSGQGQEPSREMAPGAARTAQPSTHLPRECAGCLSSPQLCWEHPKSAHSVTETLPKAAPLAAHVPSLPRAHIPSPELGQTPSLWDSAVLCSGTLSLPCFDPGISFSSPWEVGCSQVFRYPQMVKMDARLILARMSHLAGKELSPERMRQEAVTWHSFPSEVTLDLLLPLSSGRTKQSFVPAAHGWLL